MAGVTMQDPVCGMKIDEGPAVATIGHGGHVYRFCSEQCAARFQQDPDAFVGPGKRRVVDPVCGMPFRLDRTVMHYEHKGTVFHFCSEDCYHRFLLDPDDYANPSEVA